MFAEKFHPFRHIMAACICVCVSFMAVGTTNVQRCPPRTLPRRSRCCGGTRWTSWWTSCCPCPPFHRAQSSRCVCWLSSWSGACRAGSVEAKGQTSLIFIDSLRKKNFKTAHQPCSWAFHLQVFMIRQHGAFLSQSRSTKKISFNAEKGMVTNSAKGF